MFKGFKLDLKDAVKEIVAHSSYISLYVDDGSNEGEIIITYDEHKKIAENIKAQLGE